MSETKRVPLQTLEFPESSGHAAKKEKKGEKGKQLEPSFRFTLTLPESNEEAYPEFNYAQLLKTAEKKRRKEQKRGDENATNGLDPFDDDDEDKLRDMARRFEAKYGTSALGKKRRKYDDYVDLGAGYDENDSFIDNTDAYDEIVPEEMTTAHGGFYINCGPLEFKTADRHSSLQNNNNNKSNDDDDSSDSSEDESEDGDSPKTTDKRNISSSDEDEADDLIDQPRKKQKIDENFDKKLNHENPLKKKKKKQQNHQDQQINSQQDVDILSRKKGKSETTDAEGGTASEDQEEKKKPEKKSDKKFDIKKFEKKTPNNNNGCDVKKTDIKKLSGKDSNIDDAIESVVNAARVEDESSRDTMDSSKSRGALGTESECEDVDKEEAPLPEGLPEEIKEIVNTLKVHAENNKEGKNKFFNSSVNAILFCLEEKLRKLTSPSARLQTYSYLARFLPCSKGTLLNRVKKLYLEDAEKRVNEPMRRLKIIIDNVMPSVMDAYVKECQKAADEKGFEGSPVDTESTDDEEGALKNVEKPKIPKKRFPWTEETKKLVYEIANARRLYFKILRPRKESMDMFVKKFMDTKVLPLWPQGYVRLETLLKYSNPVEPPIKKKQKKLKDVANTNSLPSCTNVAGGSASGRSEILNTTNNIQTLEREKTPTNVNKLLSNIDSSVNITSIGSLKSSDSIDKKQQQQHSSKQHKERCKDNANSNMQHHESTGNVSNCSVGKISVVPTSQLMAQKPAKSHIEKFNLTNSSLSITPVNDFHKIPGKTNEMKKDVVSIMAYTEPSTMVSNTDTSSSGHLPVHRQDASYSYAQHSNYSISNQTSTHSKPVALKHRILQDSTDSTTEKKLEDKEVDVISKGEKRDKKRERCMESKYKSQDVKKRRKDQKMLDSSQLASFHSDVISIPQQNSLSKEEQEQRQIEETVAATDFLSQYINDDASVRELTDKRNDSGLVIDDDLGLVQSSEQEKSVQMVIKELQELHEMNCPPSGIQKSKSSSQYASYQDDCQRLYHKKDDKLRSKDEAQW